MVRRICIDMDGVITDFNKSFIRAANKILHMAIPEDFQPKVWHYMLQELGVSREDYDKLWEYVERSDFWSTLDIHSSIDEKVMSDLCRLTTLHDVYFLTNRVGATAKFLTERWLSMWHVRHPTVIVTDSRGKGLICKALKAELAIDDYVPNIVEISISSPETKLYMKDASYNQKDHFALMNKVNIVGSLGEMFEREELP